MELHKRLMNIMLVLLQKGVSTSDHSKDVPAGVEPQGETRAAAL